MGDHCQEGVRVPEQREKEERAKIKWLRAAAKRGFNQLDRGEGIEFGSMGELARHIHQFEK